MAKLIIINGPAGVGKTSAAKEVHKALPQSVFVSVDTIREMISAYHDDLKNNTTLAFELSNALIRKVLHSEHDVIVERMMYNWKQQHGTKDFLIEFIKSGKECDADTYEIILWATKDVVRERAHTRGFRKEGLLTPEKVESFWEEINTFKDTRPDALLIDTTKQSQDAVVAEIIKYIK